MFGLMVRKLRMKLAKLDSASPPGSTKRNSSHTSFIFRNVNNKWNRNSSGGSNMVIFYNNNLDKASSVKRNTECLLISQLNSKLPSSTSPTSDYGGVGDRECQSSTVFKSPLITVTNCEPSVDSTQSTRRPDSPAPEVRSLAALHKQANSNRSFISNKSLPNKQSTTTTTSAAAKSLYTFESPSLRRSTTFKNRSLECKNSFLGHLSRLKVQSEVKALRVLGIVFCAFIIAWLPFCLLNIVSALFGVYNQEIFQFHNALIYLTYLGYFQSTFNPIIYTVFNQKFRRNFLEILKCSKKKKNRRRI
jgi:hypothetical protein